MKRARAALDKAIKAKNEGSSSNAEQGGQSSGGGQQEGDIGAQEEGEVDE